MRLETNRIPPSSGGGGGQSLVWKYKRYCSVCGKSSNMCYCTNIDKKITDELIVDEYPCWDCYQESIERGFKQDYNDEFDEEVCRELMNQYLEPFLESEDNFEYTELDRDEIIDEDWNFKKIEDEDKIQDLIEEVNLFYSEVGDIDYENSCSCPNW